MAERVTKGGINVARGINVHTGAGLLFNDFLPADGAARMGAAVAAHDVWRGNHEQGGQAAEATRAPSPSADADEQ
jgi:hypothetical protein